MEASSNKWDPSGQEELSMEEQNYVPRKKGFHIPQFIRRNPVVICCAILGIGLVCSIALNSALFKEDSRRNTQWSQMFSNMSKEVSGINTNIMLLQEESNKSAVAVLESKNSVPSVLEELAELKKKTGRIAQDVAQVMGELYNSTVAAMGNQNSVPSVLEELAELKKKTGRIAQDVAQVMGELYNSTVAAMGNQNSVSSVLEELAELKRENSRIAEDIAQGMAELKAKGNLSPSVLEELTKLKGLTGRMAKDVIQLLGEFRNFTEELCTGCPQNWVLFEKHCYFFSTSKKPWLAAKQFCEKEAAHLLIINIQAEQSFLVKQLTSEHVFWIGLSDTIKEGEWRWVDGTPLSISFWGSGEPNNAGPGEDCATLRFTGKWNDAVCHGNEYWICEQKC